MYLGNMTKTMKIEHLKDTKELTRNYIQETLYPICESYRNGIEKTSNSLQNRTLFSLFYEPSLLTRISFERAITMLGGNTLHTEDASQFFPVKTGNYIENTVEILNSLHIDGVVIRSSENGIIEKACANSKIPIINGGSNNDHPTQALADIYTMIREIGYVDNTTVTIMGRLEHRNTSALLLALSLFENVEVRLLKLSGQVAPDIQEICESRGLKIMEIGDALEIEGSDAVYLNSPRTNAHYELLKSRNQQFPVINDEFMRLLKPKSAILDPMQRSGDFLIETNDERLSFYRQSENALFVRMAILESLMG